MKTALTSRLNAKVHSLFFVLACLVLGGLVLTALQMTWDLQSYSDKSLQESTASASSTF